MTGSLTDSYEAAAPDWRRMLARLGYDAAYEDLVTRTLGSGPVGDVLEMGCGTGALAAALARQRSARSVTLVDPSAAMLDQAAESVQAVTDAPTLTVRSTLEGFPTERCYESLLVAHVLEHLDDPADGLARLSRLMEPGGRLLLILSKPHWCQWVIWLRWRHRWFGAEAVQGWARSAGLPSPRLFQPRLGPPSRTSLAYLFTKPGGA